MTKLELVDKLIEQFPQLAARDTELAVRALIEAVSNALVSGGRVEVRGFGSFVLNHRPARRGRNPKTGEGVDVPAKYAPHFRPGKELRKRVDAALA